jgi:transcriptional regulator with XRE-family HTH domain
MHKIPREVMKYKSAIFNQETELITKLRIIRLVKSGFSQKEVAVMFGCHRNTVGQLLKKFSHLLPHANQITLLSNKHLSMETINQLMKPMKRQTSKPHHHPKQPDIFFTYLRWTPLSRQNFDKVKTHSF